MHISIVIPNYNGAELLKKNLPAVHEAAERYRSLSKHTVEIIVTDDASIDTSEEVVRSLSFPVTYLKHQQNAGFSTNVNLGVKTASGEVVVLLNSDVRPEKGFLTPLLKHFADEKVFGVGCLDKSIERGSEKKRGRGVGRFEKGFLFHAAGDINESGTLWVSGGSSAFRRELFEKLGGFYSIYNPFYWEDIDLSYRAAKSGYRVIFEPESIVVHEHDSGSIKTQFSGNKITSVAYRNQFLFVWINITDVAFLRQHLVWLPIHTFQALMRGDSNYLVGFLNALQKLPEALRLRRKNKGFFVASDTSVISASR